MKTAIITIIVCLILLPFILGTPTAHQVGTEQGNGNEKPLEDILSADTQGDSNNAQSNGLSKAEPIQNLTDHAIVVFIVSTDKDGTGTAMDTTAIVCYTRSVGDGRYVWQGMNSGWAGFDHLYYTIEANGNKNGLTSVIVVEYMLGEKTDRSVYLKEIIGL